VPFEGDESALVTMGRVAAAFGTRGWFKLKAFTEDPAGLADHARWIVRGADGWMAMRLEGFELHAKGPVAKLAGCEDREAARRLSGADIAVEREALGEAGEGMHFQVDLVGLEVVDGGGTVLGRVEGFLDTGGTSVMVVGGARERMIPFVPAYVKSVDRGAGRIAVEWTSDYDT